MARTTWFAESVTYMYSVSVGLAPLKMAMADGSPNCVHTTKVATRGKRRGRGAYGKDTWFEGKPENAIDRHIPQSNAHSTDASFKLFCATQSDLCFLWRLRVQVAARFIKGRHRNARHGVHLLDRVTHRGRCHAESNPEAKRLFPLSTQAPFKHAGLNVPPPTPPGTRARRMIGPSHWAAPQM